MTIARLKYVGIPPDCQDTGCVSEILLFSRPSRLVSVILLLFIHFPRCSFLVCLVLVLA